MILTFSKHGKGGGFGPVKYVADKIKPNGEARSVEPKILKGNKNEVRFLIDNNKNKNKYTSLVISFKEGEHTEELQNKILADFEKAAFAGLNKEDYTFLAVLHEDTKNKHIHIIVPRTHLTKNIDLNIAPPGSQKTFWAKWSNYTREKYNLEEIREKGFLDKAILTKSEKMALSKNNLSTHSKAKFEVDKFIKTNIANGLINNRQDIITLLKQ